MPLWQDLKSKSQIIPTLGITIIIKVHMGKKKELKTMAQISHLTFKEGTIMADPVIHTTMVLLKIRALEV